MQLNLRIAIWNANGLSNHIREIEVFLNMHYIDIILISETHFTSRSYFNINGYDMISTNHPDNKAHAGSCILIKNSLKYDILSPVQESYLQATNIKIKSNNGDCVVSSIYFPPRHRVELGHYEQFFKSLGNKFIVGGDYNAKHPWWGSRLPNPKGNELYKCVRKNHYKTLSTGTPTYWPTDPRRLPDVLDFAVYSGISNHCLQMQNCQELSSDHTPLIINFQTSANFKISNLHILTPHSDINCFQSWLDQNINLNVRLKNENEVDEAVENFTQLIHEAGYISTPTTHNNNNTNQLKVSTEIRELIREKRRLRKRWQQHRTPFNKSLFNKACKDLKNLLNEQKNQSTAKFIDEINNSKYDEHMLWKATRLLKRPTKRNVIVKNTDGSWCRTDKEVSEAFAKHLENIFQPLQLNTVADQEEILNFLESPCQMDFPVRHISPNEVKNEIKQLNKKKSPGFDSISGFVVKNLTNKSVIFLTLIYNSILRLHHFPSQWKCAEIIMIPKPNKPEKLLSSYRPISLLATFSKIFEKLFLKRLQPILERYNIIPEHQFGFRHKHGTPEQCHRIVNVISECLEKKQYCSAVFLDVQQAFDRVWHQGLLYKIKKTLPAPYFLFFKNYLTDRCFYVKTKDERSTIFQINAGIPQGSVLGPILYTMYTADMPTTPNTTVATYADDTAIVATSDSEIEASLFVQNAINLLEIWLLKWNIKVNSEKSIHTTFTLRRKDCPAITIYQEDIPKSETVKYLGMTMDRRLTWKQHIKAKHYHLKIKSKKLFWLLGPKSQLSLNNKLRIYKAILKPVWTYGIQIWGTASKSNIDIFERFQSKTFRLITNAPWFITNHHIRLDLNMPTVKKEIQIYSEKYLQRLSDHTNPLAISLLDDTMETRRLKRSHILDLPFRT